MYMNDIFNVFYCATWFCMDLFHSAQHYEETPLLLFGRLVSYNSDVSISWHETNVWIWRWTTEDKNTGGIMRDMETLKRGLYCLLVAIWARKSNESQTDCSHVTVTLHFQREITSLLCRFVDFSHPQFLLLCAALEALTLNEFQVDKIYCELELLAVCGIWSEDVHVHLFLLWLGMFFLNQTVCHHHNKSNSSNHILW